MAIAIDEYVEQDRENYSTVDYSELSIDFFNDKEWKNGKFSRRGDAREIAIGVITDYQYPDSNIKKLASNYKISEYQVKKIIDIAHRTGGIDGRFVQKSVVNDVISRYDLNNIDDVNNLRNAETGYGFSEGQIDYLKRVYSDKLENKKIKDYEIEERKYRNEIETSGLDFLVAKAIGHCDYDIIRCLNEMGEEITSDEIYAAEEIVKKELKNGNKRLHGQLMRIAQKNSDLETRIKAAELGFKYSPRTGKLEYEFLLYKSEGERDNRLKQIEEARHIVDREFKIKNSLAYKIKHPIKSLINYFKKDKINNIVKKPYNYGFVPGYQPYVGSKEYWMDVKDDIKTFLKGAFNPAVIGLSMLAAVGINEGLKIGVGKLEQYLTRNNEIVAESIPQSEYKVLTQENKYHFDMPLSISRRSYD